MQLFAEILALCIQSLGPIEQFIMALEGKPAPTTANVIGMASSTTQAALGTAGLTSAAHLAVAQAVVTNAVQQRAARAPAKS